MKKKPTPMQRRILILSFFLFIMGTVQAQGDLCIPFAGAGRFPDSLQAFYDSLLQKSRIPVNGKIYHQDASAGTGHPFFGSSGWKGGTLYVNGSVYSRDHIRYDLLKDQVLIQHFSASGAFVIEPPTARVERFILEGHRFFWLGPATGLRNIPVAGYYESLCRNRAEVWVRWEKHLSERSSGAAGYETERITYIFNRGQFFRVTGRGSILRAFRDRESVMKSYLKQHRIAWREADAGEWQALIDLYEAEEN